MGRFRGNLKTKGTQAGSGLLQPPKGEKFLAGGEVEVHDDVMRNEKLEDRPYDKGGGKGKVGSLPGKAMTGKGGVKKSGRGWTAKDAAAILGKKRG